MGFIFCQGKFTFQNCLHDRTLESFGEEHYTERGRIVSSPVKITWLQALRGRFACAMTLAEEIGPAPETRAVYEAVLKALSG